MCAITLQGVRSFCEWSSVFADTNILSGAAASSSQSTRPNVWIDRKVKALAMASSVVYHEICFAVSDCQIQESTEAYLQEEVKSHDFAL